MCKQPLVMYKIHTTIIWMFTCLIQEKESSELSVVNFDGTTQNKYHEKDKMLIYWNNLRSEDAFERIARLYEGSHRLNIKVNSWIEVWVVIKSMFVNYLIRQIKFTGGPETQWKNLWLCDFLKRYECHVWWAKNILFLICAMIENTAWMFFSNNTSSAHECKFPRNARYSGRWAEPLVPINVTISCNVL